MEPTRRSGYYQLRSAALMRTSLWLAAPQICPSQEISTASICTGRIFALLLTFLAGTPTSSIFIFIILA